MSSFDELGIGAENAAAMKDFEKRKRNPNTHQVGGEHYGGGAVQHWDYAVANGLGYLEGQITKYLSRWRRKGGVQDLEKALHYADKLAETFTSWGRLNREAGEPRLVEEMTKLYGLTRPERAVFMLVCGYTRAAELEQIKSIISTLLQEAEIALG